jgi:hypothetical protein
LEIQEASAPLAQQQDLMSAAIRYQLMIEDEQQSHKPATFGRIGRKRSRY